MASKFTTATAEQISDKAAEDVRRAAQAKELAEHPMLREALAELENEYMRAWVESDARDTAGRERLYTAVRVVQEFRRHLRIVIDSGRIGREHLTKLRNGA